MIRTVAGTIKLKISDKKLADFYRRWEIVEFAIFGSAPREDFRSDSDVDVLVTFSPTAHPTLFDMARMNDALSLILGRIVDLVSKPGIAASKNYLRRNAILDSAQVIYAAG